MISSSVDVSLFFGSKSTRYDVIKGRPHQTVEDRRSDRAKGHGILTWHNCGDTAFCPPDVAAPDERADDRLHIYYSGCQSGWFSPPEHPRGVGGVTRSTNIDL